VRRARILNLLLAPVLALFALAGCTSGTPAGDSDAASRGDTTQGTTAPGPGQPCSRHYPSRPLPSWERAGFNPPTLPMPYVMGDRGDIVAILWSEHDPLVVPPASDRNNKILWVARVGWGAPLQIQARLTGSDRSATRTVDGGPGPSIVDLPAPGCWSLELTWGEQHDHVQLEYAPR
jgi:hypothetical protein